MAKRRYAAGACQIRGNRSRRWRGEPFQLRPDDLVAALINRYRALKR
ncbi:hypothetical protein G3I59_24045 [Amycolatopsis rubida]|uniref:Uncharacterized protein n=1 Tax=Amycolatopsis rubida TaxID=112413 RepID=A0A1I5TUK7_9PSEU|nr:MULTISPECIES: hypothetical protein [Amycolatopsis]MYW93600.1 hypothetical protein [Amycolatopsis rubida]NEC58587.1 hypothetical protein [Amycolatopsis rubida]OAP22676.1 hypothetical protein A4R44_06549 [Amycolatopsis sp. M39]SFP86668.1 hypothetical protein SAMN05421854_107244 [Amycolatopsis rubida]